MSTQGKNWCFTLNNYTEAELESVASIECRYIIYGKEEGEAGTPHLQGYVVFNGNMRLAGVKKVLERAHWALARGSSESNIRYCSKDGEFVERGDPPKTKAESGADEKARWKIAKEMAIAGKLDEVPEDIYVRYYRTLKEIAKDHMVKPADADGVTGLWLHGPPECGKSRRARAEFPGAYLKGYNKWWDGYQGEDYVIVDDFEKDKALGHLLKIWGDRYSFIAETKGGALHIRPKKIIVTSNYSISDCFGDDPVLCAAIARRYSEIDMSPAPIVTPTSVSVAHFRKP